MNSNFSTSISIEESAQCPNCTSTLIRTEDRSCYHCYRTSEGVLNKKYFLNNEIRSIIKSLGGLVALGVGQNEDVHSLVLCLKGVFVYEIAYLHVVWIKRLEEELTANWCYRYHPSKKIIINSHWVVLQKEVADKGIVYEWGGEASAADLEEEIAEFNSFSDSQEGLKRNDILDLIDTIQLSALNAKDCDIVQIPASEEKLVWFWNMIDSIVVQHDGTESDYVRILQSTIRQFSKEDFVAFQTCYDYYSGILELHYDLQDAAYLVCGGMSDDGWHFEFKPWLISRGKKAFDLIFSNPEELICFGKQQSFCFEEFQVTIEECYQELTGEEFIETKDSYALPQGYTGVGESCDVDSYELEEKFPLLYAFHFKKQ